MHLYNHRIVKCPLAFQLVQYHLKSWWIADEIESKLLQPFCLFSFFSFTFAVHYGIFRLKNIEDSSILPTIKDSSNYFKEFFQLSKKILPTVKDSSNYFKGFFQPSRILPTVKKDSSNCQRFFQPCEKKKFAAPQALFHVILRGGSLDWLKQACEYFYLLLDHSQFQDL